MIDTEEAVFFSYITHTPSLSILIVQLFSARSEYRPLILPPFPLNPRPPLSLGLSLTRLVCPHLPTRSLLLALV